MSEYDFTFDLSMKYTQADFDAITDEEFEKTTEVFLYNRKGEEFHFIKPKVGKWIWNPDGIDWGLGAWVCSKCKCKPETWWEADKRYNPYQCAGGHFCGNCGAKMERSE